MITTRRRDWAGPAAFVVLASLLAAAPSVSSTTSTYASAAVRDQAVGTAPLTRVGLATAQGAYPQTYSVTGLTPGSSTDLLVSLQNDGSSGTSAIDVDLSTATSTSLDTDTTNGLQVRVDRCATAWEQPLAGGPATCVSASSVLLGSTPLATATGSSPDAQLTSGLSAFTVGGIDHVRLRFSLPNTAPGGWASLTSVPTLSIWGVGRPSAPTSVSAAAGDAQSTITWGGPVWTYGYSVSYTATASPGGATCTTLSTSCVLTGLVNGIVYSVSVTATNTWGTGAASTVVTIPYPASVMSSGPGMSLWLDGADAATMLASSSCTGTVATTGVGIGCWKDKSSVGENFIQASAGARPVVGSIGSLGATTFTSSSTQVLTSVDAMDTYQAVFIVATPGTTPSGYNYLFAQAGGSDFSVRLNGSPSTTFSAGNGNDWAYGTGNPAANWTNSAQAANPVTGVTQVVTAASSSARTFSASVSSSFASQGFTRGMLGPVGEVITFRGVGTTAQRRLVENYLSRKWAVTITPDQPTSVTAGVASTTSVTAGWTAASYDGGSAVTAYRATASPGGAFCTTSGATTCTITGLTHSTTYTVTVAATNSVGTGPSSAASANVTP